MGMNVSYSFNIEMINFLNLLTKDPYYIPKDRHEDALRIYLTEYYKGDKEELFNNIKEIVGINGSVHINNTLNSTLSILPEYLTGDLLSILKKPGYIKEVTEPIALEAGMVNKK